jgi:hypothetical protein
VKFSLIEQSIAATLSGLVIAAFLQLFATQSRLFVENEHEVAQQANALLVAQMLRESVQNAGHFGCTPLPFMSQPVQIVTEPPPSWPSTIRKRWLAGSAIISLTHFQEDLMQVLPVGAGETRLVLRGGPHVSPGQWLVVSNCEQAELVRIREVSEQAAQQIIITDAAMQHAYQETAQASVMQQFSWFVSHDHQLVQWRLGEGPEVWVEGVEAFTATWVGKGTIQVHWRQGKREYSVVLGLRNA